jgi:hypothetical protein
VSQKLKDGTVICNFEVDDLVQLSGLKPSWIWAPLPGSLAPMGASSDCRTPRRPMGRPFPAVVEIPHCIVADGKKRDVTALPVPANRQREGCCLPG